MSAALIRRRPALQLGYCPLLAKTLLVFQLTKMFYGSLAVSASVFGLRSSVADKWQHLQQEVESGLIDSDCCPRIACNTVRCV